MDVNPDFKTLLTEWKLSQYITKFDEEGYDCVDDWQSLLSFEDLMDKTSIGMKKGHAKKFILNVTRRMITFSLGSNASSGTNKIPIEVYINEEFLQTHSFDQKKDTFQTIEIEKESKDLCFLYLKQQILHAFQNEFKSIFNNTNKYRWSIVSNDSYGIPIVNDHTFFDQLAINNNNTNNNNMMSALKLRIIFHEIYDELKSTFFYVLFCVRTN